ncbi:MAG: hypothetical protein U0165_03705 [Polyangiaceae bacterium]
MTPGRSAIRARVFAISLGLSLSVLAVRSSAEPPPVFHIELAGLSAQRVQEAIEIELRGDASASGADVSIRGDRKRARVVVRSRKGSSIERSIDLPSDQDQAARDIALLVGNLVRDQHAAILDLFRPVASASASTVSRSSTAPSASTSSTLSRSSSGTSLGSVRTNDRSPSSSDSSDLSSAPAPVASTSSSSLAGAFTSAAPGSSASPAASEGQLAVDNAELERRAVEGRGTQRERLADCSHEGLRWMAGGADFVPYVGSSSVTGLNVGTHASFGALGSWWASTNGVALNGLAGGTSFGACGFRLSGIVDLVVGGSMRGLQVGGIGALTPGDVDGIQIGGIVGVVGGDTHGAQIGLIQVTRGALNGVQIGAVEAAREVRGAQIGVANVAVDVTGAQVGLANVATGDVRGTQIGVVNIAEDSDVPIGLINVMYKGHVGLQAVASESGHALGLIEHGGRVLHWLYGGGARGDGSGFRGVLAIGFGSTVFRRERLWLDVDALALFEPGEPFFKYQHQVSTLRLMATFPVLPHVGLTIAPTYNTLVTDDKAHAKLSPYGASSADSSANFIRFWPGVTLGLRVF